MVDAPHKQSKKIKKVMCYLTESVWKCYLNAAEFAQCFALCFHLFLETDTAG